MKNSETIKAIVNDLDSILNDIFLSGLGAVYENVIEEMSILAEKCNEIGFLLAGEKLEYIKNEICKSKHSMNFDYSKLVKEYYILSGYVDVIKGEL